MVCPVIVAGVAFHDECLIGCKRCHEDEEEIELDFLKEETALVPNRRKELIDSESTGRKRAAKLYPLDERKTCEWQGQKNCGGGRRPIVGCMDGKQKHRHHGPVKKTTYNHEGNVHRICTSCLAPGTRLLTPALEWRAIEDFIIGDPILGFPEDLKNTSSMILATVTAIKKIIEPSYKIIMEDGTEFIASHGHSWVADSHDNCDAQTRTWRKTETLTTKSVFRRYVKRWPDPPNTWEAGWLAGMYDGEGCLQRNRLTITQRVSPTAKRIYDILIKFKLNPCIELKPAKGKWSAINIITMNNRDNVLKTLGMFRPPRLLADDKLHEYLLRTTTRAKRVKIQNIKFIGDHEVIALESSSGTYIAEGYMSKNCHVRWHELNDLVYDEEDYNLLPHQPQEATGQEIIDNEMKWRSGQMKKEFELKSAVNNRKVLEEVESHAD